jgi:uncharacterized protein
MTARLSVRVHPGARRNSIRGWLGDGALKVEVMAPPENGRANRAVCEVIAAALGIKRHQVVVVRGQTSRAKQVEISGLDPAAIAERIEAAIGDNPDNATTREQQQRGQ